MKIAFDIRPLQKWDNRFRGIGCYTFNLLNHLIEQDQENAYALLTQGEIKERETREWIEDLKKKARQPLQVLSLPALNAVDLRHQWTFNRLMQREGVDVVHIPGQVGLPLVRSYKAVVTVHDLVHLKFPQTYLVPGGRRYRFRMKVMFWATARAERILAISENTKQDVREFLNVPDARIRVVYNGVSDEFRPGGVTPNKNRWDIAGRYLLYVGGIEERKNIIRMLEAFQSVRSMGYGEVKLVLAGKVDAEGEKILQKAREGGLCENVPMTGFVTNEELVALYQGCAFVVFPSLYEGFGLPAVEAMACGKTLVTSNSSSLVEVVGDAAVCVDPYNIQQIAEGMRNLLQREDVRKDLESRALVRSQLFSWEKCAREVIGVYKELKTGV